MRRAYKLNGKRYDDKHRTGLVSFNLNINSLLEETLSFCYHYFVIIWKADKNSWTRDSFRKHSTSWFFFFFRCRSVLLDGVHVYIAAYITNGFQLVIITFIWFWLRFCTCFSTHSAKLTKLECRMIPRYPVRQSIIYMAPFINDMPLK